MPDYFHVLPSPLGDILLTSDGDHLTGVRFDTPPPPDHTAGPAEFKAAVRELRAYLAGELKTFTVPVRQPGTEFQQRVWTALAAIPYGVTCSYAALAADIGQPKASRAVGSANGKNAVVIVVPCHRVIAADGSLGGYGCGLWRKEWLLALETADAPPKRPTVNPATRLAVS